MKKQTIKEIKEMLRNSETLDQEQLDFLRLDERKGVQTALNQWLNKREARKSLEEQYVRMSTYEMKAKENGYHLIAGVDEVGRGPLAGPVVAAAVILNPEITLLGLNDSKKLSEKKRLELFERIQETALAIGVGVVSPKEIDQMNILQATKKAMAMAVEELEPAADFLLVDAETIETTLPQQAIIQGDASSNSIAAASIYAKVTRDQMMTDYDKEYPGYGFAKNVGYGTKAHIEGLATHGVTPIHRLSFAPVKNFK